MSVIRGRLIPFIRLSHETNRVTKDFRFIGSQFKSVRLLSDSANNNDDNDESKKIEQAAKKITSKLTGNEGEKAKEQLMKMVNLQSEESKEPSDDIMKNISNILKGLPIEVSEKMTFKMSKRQQTDKRQREPSTWRERPPGFTLKSNQSYNARDQAPTMNNQRRRAQDYQQEQNLPLDEDSLNRPRFQSQRFTPGRADFLMVTPLNIFQNKPKDNEPYSLKTWKRLTDEEMDLAFRQPPRNAFEEMIQLTQEGKLWTFPINNEQGLEEQAKVPFYEHIFLDNLLEDIPKSGPVKEFMDLICTGVSNNPYITVERKHAIILWYVDFFKEKETILEACGAL